MAQDIVSGLFGLSPNDVAQQQWMNTNQAADKFAQMSPLQRSAQMMFKGGSGLAQAGAGMLGIQNPQIEEAKMTEAALTGLDISDPKAIAQRAQQIQDPRLKMKLMMLAQQKAAEIRKAQMDEAKMQLDESRALREEAMAAKLALGPAAEKKLSSMAQELIDAGYVQGSPEFNLAMRKRIASEDFRKGMNGGGKAPTGMTAGELRKQKYDDAKEEKEQKKIESAQSGLDALDAVRRNVTDLYDPITKKLKPAAVTLFGRVDQFRGPLTLSEDSANALSSLTGLKDQITMTNLADAKARVGQSFGSMQVQEWDKFVRLLSSLDRSMGEQKAAENLKYILDFIDKKSDVLKTALGGTKPGNQSSGSAPAGVDPKVWAAMTPEEKALWK